MYIDGKIEPTFNEHAWKHFITQFFSYKPHKTPYEAAGKKHEPKDPCIVEEQKIDRIKKIDGIRTISLEDRPKTKKAA